MKIVVIQGLLAPYRYPIFEALSKKQNWKLEVWFMGKRVKNRMWEEDALKKYSFKYQFLSGITLNLGVKDNYPFWINPTVWKLLIDSKPDAVIMMGWDSLTSFLVHIACRVMGVKFILYSDSTAMEKSWRRFITLPVVKLHVNTSDTLISGGTRNKMYLESLGAKSEKIYVSYNTVDVEKYQGLTNKFKQKAKQEKDELGLRDKKIIMYYGQLIERKGVDLLLLAYKKLKAKYNNFALLLIGNGQFRKNLEEIIDQKQIEDVIILDDPGDEMIPRYYALADIFVLPSREDVWGLVVNEAMASGLPVVVSDRAGVSADLVRNGFNGYSFRSYKYNDLASKIAKILTNENLQETMSLNSQMLINSYSPKVTVDKFSEAVEDILKSNNHVNFVNSPVKDLVSIIIPVYKDKVGLNKTVESLNRQKITGFKFEIIIGKDKAGQGSYKTRNEALRTSKGEFVAFIDAGTVAAKNWLQTGFGNISKYDYAGGPIEVFKEKGDSISDWVYLFEKNREFPVAEFMADLHFVPTTNLFVRRSLIEKIGGFDKRLMSSGDFEFGNRVFASGAFSQFYDPDLKVYHPSRNYHSLVKKQKRLAEGLVDLGRLYPERFPNLKFNPVKNIVKIFIPPIWLFSKKSWRLLSFAERIEVFMETYYFSFVQHLYAIRYVLLHER